MHGLVYPPNLLNSLPILDNDIRSLDSSTFAQLHLQHTLSHPPDNILFPFLHGLEGDNHAQNAFFATSNSTHPIQHHHTHDSNSRITPKIPKYRGLVWVVCEDDLEQAGDLVSLRILRRKPVLLGSSSGSGSSSSYSGSDEEDFDDEDDDLEMMSMSMDMDDRSSSFTGDDDDVVLASPISNSPMQVDDVAVVAPDSPIEEPSSGATVTPSATTADSHALDLVDVMQRKEDQHMHPIQHRSHPAALLPLPIPLPSIITQPQTHIFIPSSDSSTSVSPLSIFDSPAGTEESVSSAAPSECPTNASPVQQPPQQPQQTCQSDPYAPPLLTSTFRPKELLRRVRVVKPDTDTSTSASQQNNGQQKQRNEHSKWEFVPAKVPDGISLRNFGIQVPIYATLSDIIIYSPKGASPAAIALARRFRAAMKSKREERMKAAARFCGGGGGEDKGVGREGSGSPPLQQQGQGLHSPPVLSISTSTSTIVPASLANASLCDPNTEFMSNPNFNPTVHANSNASPSLDANAISKATIHNNAKYNPNSNKSNTHTNTKPEEDDDFLEYNVFVLDAGPDDLRREVPYLMMKICGPGVPGGSVSNVGDAKAKEKEKAETNADAKTGFETEPSVSSTSNGGLPIMQRNALFDVGAHTDGPDGHLVEEGIVEREEREQAERERERKEREGNGMNLDVVADMDMDIDDVGDRKSGKEEGEEEADVLLPNTVDFALREKEEMRDLTKASEIISLYPESSTMSLSSAPCSPLSSTKPGFANTSILTSLSSTAHSSSPSSLPAPSKPETLENKPPWDPLVGQVYLGNSGDVPLAPDVPSHFRHAASLARDMSLSVDPCAGLEDYFSSYDDLVLEGEEGETLSQQHQQLPADDLFNYHATNDPTHGFGYDIAVECHELAPFPSTAHLRAADEHLGMLDLLWRERWERGWRAWEEKRVKKLKSTATGGEKEKEEESKSRRQRPPPPAPPRPPPHASAVIHLPFPSSPPNSQTTMVSLMPVIRFLEKWVKPLPVPLALPVASPTSGTATPEMKNMKLMGSADSAANAAGAVPQAPTSAPTTTTTASARRWSSVAALMPSFPSFPLGGSSSSSSTSTPAAVSNNAAQPNNVNTNPSIPPPSCPLPLHPGRNRSFTSPPPSSAPSALGGAGGGIYQSPQYIPKPPQQQSRTRPLKILLYSSDGYTESSVPALCLLMAIRGLNLPEAYLELQVVKRRSFFVYQGDLGILRRVEARLKEEKERERERERGRERERERLNGGFLMGSSGAGGVGSVNANGKRTASVRGGYWSGTTSSGGSGSPYSGGSVAVIAPTPPGRSSSSSQKSSFTGRPAAKSVSFAQAPHPMTVPSLQQQQSQPPQHDHSTAPTMIPLQAHHTIPGTSYLGQAGFSGSLPTQSSVPHGPNSSLHMPYQHPGANYGDGGSGYQQGHQVIKGRPRANTSPWLPSLFGGDHQSWFNDPRFDGSFPSRVLPFLYLGNLNHASNAYMLHALGITHVVSVGECALVPPPHHMPSSGGMNQASSMCHRPGPNAHFIAGKGPGGHGSLWIEEREGRIKVLDIKGVCDDGIDTLEPQLEPICDWIDKARLEGGQVLVHCRVGVSRSATVTIAYVMKHLGLPLVDAYLIVRSRRLSVLIQPNMRLLYNLCGWEIKLAKERANGDERKIKKELARTLTWPYLAKEVHALNDKYLR
ncbi:hypothetical protein BYT27DRAFT_7188620 [Phlegmacium glaucopus]|nr:hypothetical protein BYT27DRAFT_7188620 [Phlegmacium glaucopus]